MWIRPSSGVNPAWSSKRCGASSCGQFAADSADARVQRVPPIAGRREEPFRFGVHRLRSGPRSQSSETLGAGKQLLRVSGLRVNGCAEEHSEERNDVADQVKTVVRHGYLPDSQGRR
jgi:hypothetical protein